ncbi:hypothetical protein H6A23_05685 [Olsenella uli]|uniref:hypothetical protein n=1 Tax=Olsenella uli TaxID=133926 RepID=UPI00195E99F0|nr:hypothetical protein [Olsenella uli]MBM6816655.1 hypothetical protein [Olsenella uli]
MDTTQIVADLLPAIASILEAIGFPAIIVAAARLLSRGRPKVSEEVLADLKDAGEGWSFVGYYESNHAMLRDGALKRIVLLRDSCVGAARSSKGFSGTELKKDDLGGNTGAVAGKAGDGEARPARLGKNHKMAVAASCILAIVLLALLSVPLLLQLWIMFFGQISTEGWPPIIKCVFDFVFDYPESCSTALVSVLLFAASMAVVLLTNKERKYLNVKMHSLLPALTGAIVVLAFCLGVSLFLESKVIEGSVTAPGWWHIVPPSFALVTAALVLVYTVVVRNVSEEYAIRETYPEDFFMRPLDRDMLVSIYGSISRFKGFMVTGEIVFMEAALMAGWSIMSIALVFAAAASA